MTIAVTGVPGTGKTTIAKLLSKRIGFTYIDLNKLAEDKNLYTGYDKKRNCKIVDIKKIDNEIKKKVDQKDRMVLDSHYSHLLSVDKVILLKLNTKELRERLEKRKYLESKIMENLQAEIMDVIKSEIEEKGKEKTKAKKFKVDDKENKIDTIVEIDTTSKKPEKVVNEIMGKLKI